MCIPCCSDRESQEDDLARLPRANPRREDVRCELPPPPRPQLVSLEVLGAQGIAAGVHWAVVDAGAQVTVRAHTAPDDASGWGLLHWTGADRVEHGGRDAVVPRSAVRDVRVQAQLDDVTLHEDVEVYDLVSLSLAPLPQQADGRWKAYASDRQARVVATTAPHEAKVWNLLAWSEGVQPAGGPGAHQRDVDLQPVGDRDVTVSLGGKTLAARLHICRWPTLRIERVAFDAQEVFNDGHGTLDQLFDNAWVRGRPAHAAGQDAADVQSPACFVRGQPVRITEARLEVTEAPTETETVRVQANLNLPGVAARLEGTVTVNPGDAAVVLGAAVATQPLPDEVLCVDGWSVQWQAIDSDDSTWRDAGQSSQPLYALLGAPTQRLYYTLLDISCRAAHGSSTENAFVDASFQPFVAARGTGNGFARKGDGVQMSYYNQGTATSTGDEVQTTDGMLGSAEATGRCGGWATLLMHMWAMHGVAASQRWFIRSHAVDLHNPDLRFLVKNCTFAPAGTLAVPPYTHHGDPLSGEVTKQPGLPGHGQDTPQFDFGDHVVVRHGGILYDPSYGVYGFTTDDAYLVAALDGLGRWPQIDFDIGGIPQHIPTECVRYSEGFAEYAIVAHPIVRLAQEYGVDVASLWPHCSVYDALWTPLTPADAYAVTPGCIVEVATSAGTNTHKLATLFSLADIAARHGVTEDAIFNDPANQELRAARPTRADLQTGDLVVVPATLGAAPWRVVGFDV